MCLCWSSSQAVDDVHRQYEEYVRSVQKGLEEQMQLLGESSLSGPDMVIYKQKEAIAKLEVRWCWVMRVEWELHSFLTSALVSHISP